MALPRQKYTDGLLILVDGFSIASGSTCQGVVELSSAEADIIALSTTTKELMEVHQLFWDTKRLFHLDQKPMLLFIPVQPTGSQQSQVSNGPAPIPNTQRSDFIMERMFDIKLRPVVLKFRDCTSQKTYLRTQLRVRYSPRIVHPLMKGSIKFLPD